MLRITKEIRSNFKVHELRAYSSVSAVPYSVRLKLQEIDSDGFTVNFTDNFIGDGVVKILISPKLHNLLAVRSRYNKSRYTAVFLFNNDRYEYAIPDEVFISNSLNISAVLLKVNERAVLVNQVQRVSSVKKEYHVMLYKHFLFRQFFKSK